VVNSFNLMFGLIGRSFIWFFFFEGFKSVFTCVIEWLLCCSNFHFCFEEKIFYPFIFFFIENVFFMLVYRLFRWQMNVLYFFYIEASDGLKRLFLFPFTKTCIHYCNWKKRVKEIHLPFRQPFHKHKIVNL